MKSLDIHKTYKMNLVFPIQFNLDKSIDIICDKKILIDKSKI